MVEEQEWMEYECVILIYYHIICWVGVDLVTCFQKSSILRLVQMYSSIMGYTFLTISQLIPVDSIFDLFLSFTWVLSACCLSLLINTVDGVLSIACYDMRNFVCFKRFYVYEMGSLFNDRVLLDETFMWMILFARYCNLNFRSFNVSSLIMLI